MTDTMTEDALFELLSLGCRVDAIGTVRYYNSVGRLHRVHGPAVTYEDGTHVWYQNGQLHRDGGPAVEYDDGEQVWYNNGKRHRLDGPAIEHVDGRHEWYINGKALTEAAWLQQVASMETI